jgi:hypothetical protein
MHHSDDAALTERANALADRYLGGVRAESIRWVGNQRKRWGSCNPGSKHIRISDRLRPVPLWVLDAVLVHELAHLIECSHSKRFRALADRYPRMAEADTFLHGFTIGLEARDTPSYFPEGSTTEDGDEDDAAPPTLIGRSVDRTRKVRDPSSEPAAAYSRSRQSISASNEPGRLFDPASW